MTRSVPEDSLAPFAAGLAFCEGPRWQDGALWCSHIAAGRALRGSSIDSLRDDVPGVGFP